MRRNRNKKRIMIAVAVALLTTIISYSAFSGMHQKLVSQQKLISQMQVNGSGQQETYTYAVATRDLKAGEMVSDGDVEFKDFDIKEDNAFESRSDVVNKVLLRDIQSGATFTTSHIAKVSSDDVTLRPGYRALTLPAENFQGKSKKMIPGTSVDIYSSSSDSPWKIEDVRIVAFEGGAAASSGGSASASSNSNSNSPSVDNSASASSQDITKATAITFEVSSSEIANFITNASKSKLVLVERNPNDKSVHRVSHASSYSAASYGSIPAYYSSYSSYSPRPARRKSSYRKHGSSSVSSLPNLPSAVPIKNLTGGSYGSGGLPQPISPHIQHYSSSVEMIQANVKSRVTFN